MQTGNLQGQGSWSVVQGPGEKYKFSGHTPDLLGEALWRFYRTLRVHAVARLPAGSGACSSVESTALENSRHNERGPGQSVCPPQTARTPVHGDMRGLWVSYLGLFIKVAKPFPSLTFQVLDLDHLLHSVCPISTLGPDHRKLRCATGMRVTPMVLTFTGHTIRHDGIAGKAGAHGCVSNNAAHLLARPIV